MGTGTLAAALELSVTTRLVLISLGGDRTTLWMTWWDLGKAFDVHVWSIPSARDSVTDVENMPIDTPSGKSVPASTSDPASRTRANVRV